jgi:hypothetical protein
MKNFYASLSAGSLSWEEAVTTFHFFSFSASFATLRATCSTL